jgi:hypothetical protein
VYCTLSHAGGSTSIAMYRLQDSPVLKQGHQKEDALLSYKQYRQGVVQTTFKYVVFAGQWLQLPVIHRIIDDDNTTPKLAP